MTLSTTPVDRSLPLIMSVEPAGVAVSVVIPVTERCDNLVELYRAHAEVLAHVGRSFEFIFIFDGGFEEAARTLAPLQAEGAPIRVITLPRHFGEATALTIGFEHALGDVLVTLSAYFQVLPTAIPQMLSAIDNGYDLVVSRRHPRNDSWVNRLQNWGFNALVRRLTGIQLHDISCGLRAMRPKVAREIRLYGDLHRFLSLFAFQRGFRILEAAVPQHPLDRTPRPRRPRVYPRRLLDILAVVFLLKFVKKPLRFFGLVGAGLFGAGSVLALVLIVERLLGRTPLADRPVVIVAALLMVLGVQVGSVGLLGEIIVFTHARKLKDYAIDRILG